LRDKSLDVGKSQPYQDWLKGEIDRVVADETIYMKTMADGKALAEVAKTLSSSEISTKYVV
jgi:hypothetical protein